MSYLAEPFDHSKNKLKVELDLPNYETKYNLKSTT